MSVDYTAISPTHRARQKAAGAGLPLEQTFRAVARFFGGIATDYRLGTATRQLHALSDETLRDIGIHRSEIPSLVRDLHFNGVDRRRGQN